MSNEIIKTENAAKVLQLMDSTEDGGDRYNEFVSLIAKENGISVSQLEAELDPFI
jgi:Ca2+-binding EF-hand superfamily protein